MTFVVVTGTEDSALLLRMARVRTRNLKGCDAGACRAPSGTVERFGRWSGCAAGEITGAVKVPAVRFVRRITRRARATFPEPLARCADGARRGRITRMGATGECVSWAKNRESVSGAGWTSGTHRARQPAGKEGQMRLDADGKMRRVSRDGPARSAQKGSDVRRLPCARRELVKVPFVEKLYCMYSCG